MTARETKSQASSPSREAAASLRTLSSSARCGALVAAAILACACSTPNGGGDWQAGNSGDGEDGGASQVTTPSQSEDAGGSSIVAPRHDAGTGAGGHDAGTSADAKASTPAPDAAIPAEPGWTLVWSDEFNLANGSGVDGAKWTQETGNGSWNTNHEREYYTPGKENAVIQDGALVITAKSDGASAYDCEYGTCQYTSARMNTAGKFEQKYGRFEARIKLPQGQGLWPAWWLLGNDIGSVGWPQCGEADIMENVGSTPATNYGSLHGPGYSGGQDLTGSYDLPGGGTLGDDFHVYAFEWEENEVRFYFDGVNYETRTPADVPSGDVWVYDHPFFVILNVAVGGYWPGDPDGTTTFPQTMQVDYVRVYSKSP